MRSQEVRTVACTLLAFVVLLAAVLGPGRNVAFAAGSTGSMESHLVARGAESAAEPCCDDCGTGAADPCPDSALCMAACGKLPAQPIAFCLPVLSRLPAVLAAAPAVSLAGSEPPPLRRPPRTA